IIREIQTGVPPHAAEKVTVEVDRARAIAQAIADADADDTVLLAGTGHEDYQIIRADDGGTVKVHFDDREHAVAALQARAAARAVAGRAKTSNIPGPARRT